ncbi:putative serine/threonine-protein kinase iks1 [Marasmius sp. AFHP31]|nr:putative serine/threonine-protein kinase iks1 [Marasmius sp. AFHP31]
MKTYKTRHLRYCKPLDPYVIHDLDIVPADVDTIDTMELDADLGYSTECSFRTITNEGPCLNLIVEEPLPIKQLEKEDRFYSREVILFLKQHHIDVYPSDRNPHVSFGLAEDGTELWCKLTTKREVEVFRKLKDLNPASHHLATLFLEPYLLPNGDWLITMPDFGENLEDIVNNAPRYLAGSVMLKISRQLCTAVSFLHLHNMCHLDIKPQNIVAHIAKDCESTLVDLGWVTSGRSMSCATGTYDYAPPEVRKWFDWEWRVREEGSSLPDEPQPESYSTRKADAWAVGNVIAITLRRLLNPDKPTHVDHRHDLLKFAKWMMAKRPPMKVALERLDHIAARYGAPRTPSPTDVSAVEVSP